MMSAAAPWSKPSERRAATRNSRRWIYVPAAPVTAWSGDTIKCLGGLDILVNNAGILYTADALDTSDEQWLDTMAVNVQRVVYLSRAAVKHMKAAGKGAIVNVASEWGPQRGSQSCGLLRQQGSGDSDHPLHGLGSCARQYPRQFVCPGEIHTRMVDDILAKRGGDPARNLRDLAAESPCGAWHIPPKSRAACISWPPISQAT